MISRASSYSFFFFNDTATTEIYTLSLHDALPISHARSQKRRPAICPHAGKLPLLRPCWHHLVLPVLLLHDRSEEHTSELQSRPHLVCRLLLEKKKSNTATTECCTATRPRVY